MPKRRTPVRRFSTHRRRWLAIAGILIVALLLRLADRMVPPGPMETIEPGAYRVQRVVDGDTLLLVGGARVRLIGADTPEAARQDHPAEPFATEATEFAREFVAERGDTVRLEFDGPRKDLYGRFLATVWVGDRMLNEELLRAGLARLRSEFPFSPPLKARLRRAEQEAQAAGRGLHGPLPSPAPPTPNRHSVTRPRNLQMMSQKEDTAKGLRTICGMMSEEDDRKCLKILMPCELTPALLQSTSLLRLRIHQPTAQDT